MSRRMVGTLLALALAAALLSGGAVFGVGTVDGRPYGYAGMRPVALGFSVLLLALFLVPVQGGNAAPGAPVATLRRRCAAAIIDGVVVITILVPVLTLVVLALETRRGGGFAWSFSRSEAAPTDGLILPLVGIVAPLIAVLGAWAWTGTRGAGMGGRLLGIAVEDRDGGRLGARGALIHVGLGFVALVVLPWSLWRGTDADGRSWWDRVAGTRVARTDHGTPGTGIEHGTPDR
jgi:uncharacterized RDD family membrane protein YckC